jgi:hypothetical protein
MKLISILLSSVVALGVAGAAMAQDAAPAAGPPAGPPGGGFGGGGFRGGAGNAPRPDHKPAEGGAYGVIASVTEKGFTMTAAANQPVIVNLAPDTTYRMGKAKSTAHAIKVGERVRVLGAVAFGVGFGAGTNITATHIVLQPVEGAGTETSLAVASAVVQVLAPVQNGEGNPGGQAGPRAGGGGRGPGGPGAGRGPGGPGGAAGPGGPPGAAAAGPGAGPGPGVAPHQGLAIPARHIGTINPDWGDASDPRTSIAAGEEADKATEVAMAVPYDAGGIVDRVVKEPDGAYLVHSIGTSWPHHIFVTPDFKVVGAAN